MLYLGDDYIYYRPKHGTHDWSFLTKLVIYVMCSCIGLVKNAMFWRTSYKVYIILFYQNKF
jgi:hypothetical protein